MLGLTLYPTNLSYRDGAALARRAEDAGFGGVFFVELRGNNDALMAAQAAAVETSRIMLGTNIANVYLRHPGHMAAQAVAVDELSDGRLVLGIGTSNQRAVEDMGLHWHQPTEYMTETTRSLRALFAGEAAAGLYRPRLAAHAIPIHWAGVSARTIEAAGAEADGLMAFLAPPERCREVVTRFREASPQGTVKPVSLLTPVFLSEDLAAARAVASEYLSHYLMIPLYRRMFAQSGFEEEIDRINEADPTSTKAMRALVSDRLADAIALIGPPSRCREQLARFGEAGIDDPLLSPQAVDADIRETAEQLIDTFGDGA